MGVATKFALERQEKEVELWNLFVDLLSPSFVAVHVNLQCSLHVNQFKLLFYLFQSTKIGTRKIQDTISLKGHDDFYRTSV